MNEPIPNRNHFLNSQPVLFYNTEHLVHTYASHSCGICQKSEKSFGFITFEPVYHNNRRLFRIVIVLSGVKA